MAKKLDPIARTRAYALPYGERSKIMLIDYAGAAEYGLFGKYDEPIAVYPTWTPEDGYDQLRWLCENPPGRNPKLYNDRSLGPESRPIKDQKHRIVVWKFKNDFTAVSVTPMLTVIRDFQAEYDVEIFVSGLTRFEHMLSYDLLACDFRPQCLVDNAIHEVAVLPSGKYISRDIYDPRYKDWFELLGMSQIDIFREVKSGNRRILLEYNLRSMQWAKANWDKVEPFVLDRKSKVPEDRDFSDRILQPNTAFTLPATRRRVMRNLGLPESELDRFACDVCIMHNTCKLYREGAVCAVEGTEAVALSKAFGTRNADRIIDGLSQLLEKQAERLEDAMAAEDPQNPNPDVTRQVNSVFANGVKLAKLIDPTLAGGPKVTVNVGVGQGGQAAIVAQQDPRQITAQVMRELEASGIPREQITAEMLAGYFKNMGINTEEPARKAIQAVKATVRKEKPSVPEDYDAEEALIEKPMLGALVGEIVE